jgi:hypothetical protein
MPTNATTRRLAEVIAGESPSKAAFQTDGGSATMDFILDHDETGEMIQNILGSVKKSGDGGLERKLPAAHPYYDWLYASKISSIQGMSPDGRFLAAPLQRQNQIHIRDVVTYSKYKISVDFETRPYLIASDSTIKAQHEEKTWYYDIANNSVKFKDCKEYLRFLDIDCEQNAEFLSSPQGQFKFIRTDALPPNSTSISNQNGGGINIIIAKRKLKFTWFFVPYQVVFQDQITYGLGKVNQYSFYGYPPGSLLLEGVEVKKYPPPVQDFLADPLTQGPVASKVCDVTFICSCLVQSTTDLGGGIPAYPPGGQYKVPFGHNLVPWPGDLKFYYTETQPPLGVGLTSRPVYGSYPFERLFLVN